MTMERMYYQLPLSRLIFNEVPAITRRSSRMSNPSVAGRTHGTARVRTTDPSFTTTPTTKFYYSHRQQQLWTRNSWMKSNASKPICPDPRAPWLLTRPRLPFRIIVVNIIDIIIFISLRGQLLAPRGTTARLRSGEEQEQDWKCCCGIMSSWSVAICITDHVQGKLGGTRPCHSAGTSDGFFQQ
jgi:hypothetical protein